MLIHTHKRCGGELIVVFRKPAGWLEEMFPKCEGISPKEACWWFLACSKCLRRWDTYDLCNNRTGQYRKRLEGTKEKGEGKVRLMRECDILPCGFEQAPRSTATK